MSFPTPWTFATAGPATPSQGMPWWLWVAVSIVPDIMLVVSLIAVWRYQVSSRRQTRQELTATRSELTRNSESLWLATELADVGVWSWDLVAGVLTWSDRCKVHFGLPTSQPVDIDRFYAALHPDDRERVRSEIDRSRAERTEFRTTYRAMLPDGSQHELAAMGRFTYDARGRPLSMEGVTLDISRIEQLELDLRTAESVSEQQEAERHRLRAMIMGTLNPVVLCQPVRDASGKTVDFIYADFNQAACDFIGIDRAHLLGRRLVELFPQLKATGLLARFSETADTGRPFSVDDFPFPMDGGAVHNIDVRVVRVDEWVSFHWRDNSDRYAAMERVAASEERFRLLAENMTDVVVRLDAKDEAVWVSPSVTNVLGWSEDEVVGHSSLECLATEDAREQYRHDKARVFAGQGAVSWLEVRSKSGAVHWMEAHSSPFRMPDGRIDGVIAAMRVIDAEVMAERALERRARIDDLTGLLNRKELVDRLDGLIARGVHDFAVLWCDIDRFKEINDAKGHAAGDAVLEALGERIRACLPTPNDLGARIGGDELMVVLRGVHDLDAATRVADRLRCTAAEPLPFGGGTIVATLSIGVTLALPDEGVDVLLARADEAMYQAKEQGRNRVVALGAAAGSDSRLHGA